MSNKYSQKFFDNTNKSTTEEIEFFSKRAIQKAAESTCDLIGKKIADQITILSIFLEKFHSKELR